MKKKLTFGRLTINMETCPEKKEDFVKMYYRRIPDVDKAWKEIIAWRKEDKKEVKKVEKV